MPNAIEAIVDLRRFTECCLNPDHSRDKHKAGTFQSVPHICRADATRLRDKILELALTDYYICGESGFYGTRYTVDLA